MAVHVHAQLSRIGSLSSLDWCIRFGIPYVLKNEYFLQARCKLDTCRRRSYSGFPLWGMGWRSVSCSITKIPDDGRVRQSRTDTSI